MEGVSSVPRRRLATKEYKTVSLSVSSSIAAYRPMLSSFRSLFRQVQNVQLVGIISFVLNPLAIDRMIMAGVALGNLLFVVLDAAHQRGNET